MQELVRDRTPFGEREPEVAFGGSPEGSREHREHLVAKEVLPTERLAQHIGEEFHGPVVEVAERRSRSSA